MENYVVILTFTTGEGHAVSSDKDCTWRYYNNAW